MQTVQFVNGNIYHITNRGVDKRTIFQDKGDYFRFIHDLFEFNDSNPAPDHNLKKQDLNKFKISEVAPHEFENILENKEKRNPRKLLVKILAWCLMPNHFHLLIEQLIDGGITLFMRKLGAYTLYFNTKHERAGRLFQNRFKAAHVLDEKHFLYLPFYIHCNSLDLEDSGWRSGKINNWKKAVDFLEAYRFSSHLDYIGKNNFPSLTQRDFLLDVFEGSANYKKQCYGWLKAMDRNFMNENLDFKDILLEK